MIQACSIQSGVQQGAGSTRGLGLPHLDNGAPQVVLMDRADDVIWKAAREKPDTETSPERTVTVIDHLNRNTWTPTCRSQRGRSRGHTAAPHHDTSL